MLSVAFNFAVFWCLESLCFVVNLAQLMGATLRVQVLWFVVVVLANLVVCCLIWGGVPCGE